MTVTIERKTKSKKTKITPRLTAVIRTTVLLPLWPISATTAAGPVTYALTPGGGGVRSTTSLMACTDSFATAWPKRPTRAN
jgi:hypothetical protein